MNSCVQLGHFLRASTSLHSNFTWTVSDSVAPSGPSTIHGIRKPETLGYPKVKSSLL